MPHSGLGHEVPRPAGHDLELAPQLGHEDPEVVALLVVARTPHLAEQIGLADQGSGALETIFEPFQRLGDVPAGDGVGLGLAVARGLMEAMGGTLTAEETPGGGLTLVVDLPVAVGAR